MGSIKIRNLQLPQNLIESLEKHNIVFCKDVLSLTKVELQSLLGVSRLKVENLICEVSNNCVSAPQNVFDMFLEESSRSNRFLSLSMHAIDLMLSGGLPFGTITELAGPPGVGKTQFSFMLSILAAIPAPHGLESEVLYIDTESTFSAERLKSMAECRFSRVFKEENVSDVLRKIFLQKANSVVKLKEIICHLDTALVGRNVKLVVLDSIASLVRKEFSTDVLESRVERNQVITELAAKMKEVAKNHDLVVFVTNQIATAHPQYAHVPVASEFPFDEDEMSNNCPVNPADASAQESTVPVGDNVVPALGNTWAHCVNTRLVAQFVDVKVRQLVIVKSPIAPNAAVRYTIDESGIHLTDDDIEFVNVKNFEQQGIVTKNNFLD